MTEQNKPQIVLFNDNAQRTLVGRLAPVQEAGRLIVVNPVVVNYAPETTQDGRPTGRIQIQFIPAVMRDFLAVSSDEIVMSFPFDQVTEINCKEGWSTRLIEQYTAHTRPPQIQEASQPNQPTQPRPGQRIELFPSKD